jgi:hypothetical protein
MLGVAPVIDFRYEAWLKGIEQKKKSGLLAGSRAQELS